MERATVNTPTNTSDVFYAQLPTFAAFEQCVDVQQFHDVPDDWHIVIADIQSSTQAIVEGRYREVNAVGVACIVAVMNAVKPLQIPFIFGGDGATFCVPASQLARVQAVLMTCVNMAAESAKLVLRVGCVSVSYLRQRGRRVAVAKYAANPHYHQAMLSGNGWLCAEQLIKSDEHYQLREVVAANDVDFSGFECRWNEIRSPQGENVSLLVMALPPDDDEKRGIYNHLLCKINDIYGTEAQHHPVPIEQLSLSFSWQKLAVETRIRQHNTLLSSWCYRVKALLLIAAGKYLMNRNITTEDTQWGEYKQRLRANTDYRKFDEMLRMVMAGTAAQREKLTAYLSDLQQQGKIVFGIHASEAVLITCVISDYNYRHWHFLDGASGGYTMAAVQMKQQLAAQKTNGF